MRILIVIMLLSAIFFATEVSFTDAINTFESVSDALLGGFKSTMAKAGFRAIPMQQQRGVNEYLQVLGANPNSTTNRGISEYNSKMLSSNSCFKDLASIFYADINTIDIKKSLYSQTNEKWVESGNPTSLADKLPDGFAPGWFWEKALKYTNNDKTLAFQLIALCGHDNAFQFEKPPFQLSKNFVGKFSDRFTEVDRSKLKTEVSVYCSKRENRKLKLDACIDRVQKRLNYSLNIEGNFGCPLAGNPIYLPKSLGEKVDIEEKLKKKITTLQAPSLGSSALPAKYYHLMGGAFSSCLLIRRGIPKFVVNIISQAAINAYRSGTLCENLKEITPEETLQDKTPLETQLEWVNKYRQKRPICVTVNGEPPADASCQAEKILSRTLLDDSDITTDILAKKIKTSIARTRAKIYFINSPDYKKVNQCNGLQSTEKIREYFDRNGTESNPCPKNISTDECKAVKNVMATWAVDFEWSEAQHRAGVEFAAKNCPNLPAESDPLLNSCDALKKLKASENNQQNDLDTKFIETKAQTIR